MFTFCVVIPPNSKTFSHWRKMFHVSWIKTHELRRETTFRLACDQVVLLETGANLGASRRKANDFFAFFSAFEVGRYNKTLNDWPRGKQWVLFPLDLNVRLGEHWRSSGNQNPLFPTGPVIKCLMPYMKQSKEKAQTQTLASPKYGLEIIFKSPTTRSNQINEFRVLCE